MKKTTKAAVVRAFREPLVLEEVRVPAPGPGQILVKLAATRLQGAQDDEHEREACRAWP